MSVEKDLNELPQCVTQISRTIGELKSRKDTNGRCLRKHEDSGYHQKAVEILKKQKIASLINRTMVSRKELDKVDSQDVDITAKIMRTIHTLIFSDIFFKKTQEPY